ncbi:Glycosyltransferase involved in cell wall bisynthesis [Paenibacillus sp. 1_12]|uniref:glycosyltransferase family 4 protein n=1 Tax=Paenibacillus sp. 1_12 TaxID=1566278 RepID=UPI0008DF8A93|nr:glycosyltransferase family 4 protein [Paenibacillus sp. 1_12]SFK72496.1 Glycosyltransferase involved in cell wall bisynthesis [Paenibacillus sp. 1_12]
MKVPVVAIITPGSFVVPCATSSSVELVVEQVARRMTTEVCPIIFGKQSPNMPSSEVLDGVQYIRVPARSPRGYISQVSQRLKALRPALLQVENRPRFVRYLRKRYPRAIICLVLHSITYISTPHISRTELQSCLRAADCIVVNSYFMKEQLLRRAPDIRRKIKVNYLGVDTEQFISRWTAEGAERRLEALEQLGLGGKKIILYVGRLLRMKGVHHLLEAMPEVVKRVPNAVVFVVGSAFYSSPRTTHYVRGLKRIATRLKAPIRFIPYVPHTSIVDWYRLADVLVVPSGKNEAFGLVNVEAMASGVPVVATHVGGMKEIIEHERTGLSINPAQLKKELAPSIIRLLTNPEWSQALGEASVLKVQQQFTWERTAARWLNFYREQLNVK